MQEVASESTVDESIQINEDQAALFDNCPQSATASRFDSDESTTSYICKRSCDDVESIAKISISNKRSKSSSRSRDFEPNISEYSRRSAIISVTQSPTEDDTGGNQKQFQYGGEEYITGYAISPSVDRDNPKSLSDHFSLSTPSSVKMYPYMTDVNRGSNTMYTSQTCLSKTLANTSCGSDIIGRFVSPNTASVASALSLLSRLPFY